MNVRADIPSFDEFRETLSNAINLFKKERESNRLGRINGVHIIDRSKLSLPLIIIGDIHGDFYSLSKILNELNSLSDFFFIALGDYIDRGPAEGQVLSLYELLKLKEEFTEKVILLRGNHEPAPGLEPYPHDFPYALASLYGTDKAKELYGLTRELFEELPYAIVIREVALLVHGGPPTFNLEKNEPEYLGYASWPPNLKVLEEVLWNDPSDFIEVRAPNPRGAGSLWGIKVTREVLKKLNVALIIRGHEPALEGYKLNHENKVLTLFSRLGSPYYNPQAAYVFCDDLDSLIKNVVRCIKTFS
jgi:hypothetical protein